MADECQVTAYTRRFPFGHAWPCSLPEDELDLSGCCTYFDYRAWVLDRWNARRSTAVPPELIGRIAPTRTEGINLRGVFSFPIE